MGRPLVRTRKIADISNVAASATCSDQVRIRKNIHGLMFYFESSGGTALTRAQMLVDISTIKLRMNGVQIWELSITELLDLYKYKHDDNGSHTVAGCVPLVFTRPDLPFDALRRQYRWGMKGPDGSTNNLTYEITFTAGLTTASTGEVFVMFDDEEVQEFGKHIRFTKRQQTHSATGTQEISNLPVSTLKNVLAYHIHKANVDSVSVKYNGVDVYDQEPYSWMKEKMLRAGRTAQTGYTHVPFDLANDDDSFLPMGPGVDDFILIPNWGTSPAGAYWIIEEAVHDGL